MKQTLLLLLAVFYYISGYSQFPENFESPFVTVPNIFPEGWLVADNGVGTGASWVVIDNSTQVINGTKSAFINRENIGIGNTSSDWLITPAILVPTNGQLRFFAKQ